MSSVSMRKKNAALVAIVLGIVIFGIKFLAYLLSNSVALLSDALESIVNIAASGLMLFAVYVSEKPADAEHKYGHQRVEEISRLLEGILIVAAMALIIYAASARLFQAPELLKLNTAIAVSIVATALNGCLSLFLGRMARESGSAALEGDSKHLLSDVASSAGVWIGLLIVQLTGWSFMDSVLAFAVSALIARMGASLILKSSSHLMDESCKEEEAKICEVLQRHKSEFTEYHNLRSRRHGNQILAEMHLTVDSSWSVREAHDLTDHLQTEVAKELPTTRLTVHVEPEG